MSSYGIGGGLGPPPEYTGPRVGGVGAAGIGVGAEPGGVYATPPPGMYEAYRQPVSPAATAVAPMAPLEIPPVALRPPPTELSLEMARRGPASISTGGISAVQKRVGALGTPSLEISPETQRLLGETTQQYGEAEAAEEEVEFELEQAMPLMIAAHEEKRAKLKDLDARKAKFKAEHFRERDKAQLEYQYAGSGLTADQIEKVQTIASGKDLDDPDREVSPEEQQAAQRKLTKWQSIDPNRAFSGGKRIMAAIGMAMGAYASAITGTPNFAMQIVKDAIARDIDEQRFRFAKMKGRIGELKDRFAMNMKRNFGDEEKSILDTWDDYYKFTQMKIQMFAQGAASQERQAKLLQTGTALQAEQDKLRAAGAEASWDKAFGIEQLQLQAEKAKLGARSQEEMLRIQTGAGAAGKELPDTVKNEVAASYSVTDAVTKMRSLWNAKIKGEAALARILEPGHTFRDEWDLEAKLLGVSVMRMIEKGRMSDKDREFYLKLVPSVGDWSKTAMDKLSRIQDFILKRRTNVMKVYGQLGYETIPEEPTAEEAMSTFETAAED